VLSKTLGYASVAILLGIAVMLIPVITFSYFYPKSDSLGTGEATSQPAGMESIYRNAQVLGKEADSEPFSSSLAPVAILTSICLIVGLGVFLFFKRKF
jgi:hypothetical protein